MQVYEDMAECYDLIYSDYMDLEFYLREARNARGSVLEAGCGTGRILLHLIQAKIDAVGLDTSKAMLDVLKRKAEKKGLHPSVLLADMADFRIDKRFKLIIIPYRSFLHLKDDRERMKALKNFYSHLAEGGRLIIHTYNLSDEERQMTGGFHPLDSDEAISPDGKIHRLNWFLDYRPDEAMGLYKIVIASDDGKTREFVMSIYFASPKSVQDMLKASGFKDIKAYCGFDYSAFNSDCREVMLIAYK